MNTGTNIKLIVMGITFCFLIYSWLNYRMTMKKVKLKREEMDRRHGERMRQYDEHLRQLQWLYQQRGRRSAMIPNEGYMPSAMFKTDKLSPTKITRRHKMSMT